MSILSFRTVRHFLAVEASSRNNRAASEIDPKADKHLECTPWGGQA
jgi:hypothetical protein